MQVVNRRETGQLKRMRATPVPAWVVISRQILNAPVVAVLVSPLVGVIRGMLHDQKRRAKGLGADIVMLPPGASVLQIRSAPMPEQFLDVLGAIPPFAFPTGPPLPPSLCLHQVTGRGSDPVVATRAGLPYVQ